MVDVAKAQGDLYPAATPDHVILILALDFLGVSVPFSLRHYLLIHWQGTANSSSTVPLPSSIGDYPPHSRFSQSVTVESSDFPFIGFFFLEI